MRTQFLALTIAALALASATSVAQATDRTVPYDYGQITSAIAASSNGDTVTVTSGSAYGPFVVTIGLLIRNTSGGVVTITGTDSYALEIRGSTATVDGFKFSGGTGGVVQVGSGTVQDCSIEDGGTAYANSVVQINGGGKLINCPVTLTSTTSAQAIYIPYSGANDAEVTGCTITCAKGNSGGNYEAIRIESGESGVDLTNNSIEFTAANTVGQAIACAGTYATIEDNVITGPKYGVSVAGSYASISRNIIHVGGPSGGWGIDLAAGSSTVENNTVYRDTCDAGYNCLVLTSSPGTNVIENNLLVHGYYGIYYFSGTTDTFYHNIFWGTCGHKCNRALTDSEIAVKEPFFCGEQEGTGEFTQRIDSHAAPGNNGWGELVGVEDIECAWGTLDSTTTVPASKTVTVLEDVTVPSGTTLTLGSGVQFKFDDDDNSGSGLDTSENELIVTGTMRAIGTSGSKVKFVSSATSPGESDWWGVRENGVRVTVMYAEFNNADYGLVLYGGTGADTVQNCTFESNAVYDMKVASAASDAVITNNTVTVGGGAGVELYNAASFSGNTITGNDLSSAGIEIPLNAASFTMSSNTVSGLSNGPAVQIYSTATLTQNELKNSKQGIKVGGGDPLVGTSSSSSDNLIHGNTTGILSTCSGSGSCPDCSTAPVIRNNQIYSNTYGVTREKKGEPNLGTDGSTNAGNNSIYDNTYYCIWNRTTCDTIQAQGNWFGGDCENPPAACTSGWVNITNSKCEQPADATWAVEPVPESPVQGLRVKGIWPNPFRAGVTIQFEIGKDLGTAAVLIFDVTGRLIRDLGRQQYPSGVHEVAWDGSTDSGMRAANGLYFVRVVGDGRVQGTSKVLVAR